MAKYNDYNNKKAYEKYKKVIAAEKKFFEENGLKGERLENILEYTKKQFKEAKSAGGIFTSYVPKYYKSKNSLGYMSRNTPQKNLWSAL